MWTAVEQQVAEQPPQQEPADARQVAEQPPQQEPAENQPGPARQLSSLPSKNLQKTQGQPDQQDGHATQT